jgi:predicted dehydrogenase
MARVRIGFVGAGGMGQCAHLRNYVTVPGCEVTAIAELRPGLGELVAARYGVPRVYRDHEQMLSRESLDAIVASQPFTRHGTLIPELLAARIPVFTEKPLAGTIEMGGRVVAAAAAAGTWSMVGYHKRSDPATMAAKAEIDRLKGTGELGRMTYVRVSMPAGDWIASGFTDLITVEEKAPPMEWDPPASDMDKDTFESYFQFVNYYIHQVNLMRHLLGEPWHVTFADPSGVLLAGRSVSGVACSLEMSPYRTTVDWQESALVAFERGWVKLELPAPLASNRPGTVAFFRDPGAGEAPRTIVPQLPWVHAMRQQAVNFVAAVRGERAPMCDGAEALQDLEVARQYIRLWKGV